MAVCGISVVIPPPCHFQCVESQLPPEGGDDARTPRHLSLSLQLGLGLNRMGGSLSLEASENFDKNDGITR